MAFTFDATISGVDSNSYVLVADADDYFSGTYEDDGWSSLTTAQKEQLLVIATTRLESEQYGGYATLEAQRLQYPRANIISRYAADYKNNMGGYPSGISQYYADDEMPKDLQQATFELARYFLNKENDNLGAMDEIDLEQLSSYEIGPLSVDIQLGFKVEQLPSNVRRKLAAIGPDAWLGGQQTKAVRG